MACSNTLIHPWSRMHCAAGVMAVYSIDVYWHGTFGALLGGAIADRVGAPIAVLRRSGQFVGPLHSAGITGVSRRGAGN